MRTENVKCTAPQFYLASHIRRCSPCLACAFQRSVSARGRTCGRTHSLSLSLCMYVQAMCAGHVRKSSSQQCHAAFHSGTGQRSHALPLPLISLCKP